MTGSRSLPQTFIQHRDPPALHTVIRSIAMAASVILMTILGPVLAFLMVSSTIITSLLPAITRIQAIPK